MSGTNVGVDGKVEIREIVFKTSQGQPQGKALCYQYVWRGRKRIVWLTLDARVLDLLLEEWWPRLTIVPLDLEYFPQSSEPAVVSIGVSRDVTLLWHRPDLENCRQLPARFAQLLGSESIPKIGFAIDNDIQKLAASTDLLGRTWPKGLFDIQTFYRIFRGTKEAVGMTDVVNSVNPPTNQFQKLTHDGNWAKANLSHDQVIYAAGDVFVTWEVVDALVHHSPSTHSTESYHALPSNVPSHIASFPELPNKRSERARFEHEPKVGCENKFVNFANEPKKSFENHSPNHVDGKLWRVTDTYQNGQDTSRKSPTDKYGHGVTMDVDCNGDIYVRMMGELRMATEMVQIEDIDSASWLAQNCPEIIRRTMNFLMRDVGEEKLPRLSKFRKFLVCCCPSFSAPTSLGKYEKRNLADMLTRFLFTAQWIGTNKSQPNRLLLNFRNPILRFILSQK
jgi:3'-5' exonuclease